MNWSDDDHIEVLSPLPNPQGGDPSLSAVWLPLQYSHLCLAYMETSFSIHNLKRHHAVAIGTHLQSLLPSCLEALSCIYNLRPTVPWWLGPTCGCCYSTYLEAFSSIYNLRMRHAVVIGAHLSWFETCSWFRFYIEDYSCAAWDLVYIFLCIYWYFHARTECLGSASDRNIKSLLLLYILLVTTLGALVFQTLTACRPWLTCGVITMVCHN